MVSVTRQMSCTVTFRVDGVEYTIPVPNHVTVGHVQEAIMWIMTSDGVDIEFPECGLRTVTVVAQELLRAGLITNDHAAIIVDRIRNESCLRALNSMLSVLVSTGIKKENVIEAIDSFPDYEKLYVLKALSDPENQIFVGARTAFKNDAKFKKRVDFTVGILKDLFNNGS
jgi:hypothetical protein